MSNITFHPNVATSVEAQEQMLSPDESAYMEFTEVKNRIPYRGDYAEMISYVTNNILKLLSSAVDKKPRALQIITSREFLYAMSQSGVILTREYINRFNRVYRAYMINPSKNVIYNQVNADMLYNEALRLNKDTTDSLMKIGLSQNNALWLAVNMSSSTDSRRNIRRMVRAMQHMDPEIMNEKMIFNIFSKTFNDQLTNLFVSIMTDRFDAFDSEDEKYVYSTISNVILSILNAMPEEEILDILAEYADELSKSGVSGRFSLRTVNSGDYGPICRAVDELESRGVKVY